jgi:hypothetical protein
MTQEEGEKKKNLRAKGRTRHFAISSSLGAGVTPAQGSVKRTAGFTSNQVVSSSALP